MNLKEPEKWIHPDRERFSEQPRNLAMDCSLIEKHDIHFADSIEGIKEALLRPYRTE